MRKNYADLVELLNGAGIAEAQIKVRLRARFRARFKAEQTGYK